MRTPLQSAHAIQRAAARRHVIREYVLSAPHTLPRESVRDALADVDGQQLVFAAFLQRNGVRVTVNGKRVSRTAIRAAIHFRGLLPFRPEN